MPTTNKVLYKNVEIKALEYVFRELTHENGGFYCAEDADSEGEEGKYYVFNPLEILKVLGEEDGTYFNEYLNVTTDENFEGKSIPNLINNSEFNKENNRIRDLSDIVLHHQL